LENPLDVRFGRPVEVPLDDQKALTALTYEAYRTLRYQRAGWLARYMLCLNEQNRIVKKLIGLSHQD